MSTKSIWSNHGRASNGECQPDLDRVITSVAEGVASGFKVAVDTHLLEVRRTMEQVAQAVDGLSKGVEALKEGQAERRVILAQHLGRIEKNETDVKELKNEIKSLYTINTTTIGTVNKGIGAALILASILPIIVTVILKAWH